MAPSVTVLTEFGCNWFIFCLTDIRVSFRMLFWRDFLQLPEMESLLAVGWKNSVSHEKHDWLQKTLQNFS